MLLGNYYIGHEIILKKKLIRYGFDSNLIGCHFNKHYFISKKVVLLTRDTKGNYLYLKDNQEAKVIDPNDLIPSTATLECNNCILNKDNAINCESINEIPDEIIGIVGIHPIASLNPDGIITEHIPLVREYNNIINESEEYIPVDAITYPTIKREIDDNIKNTLYINNISIKTKK